MSKIEINGVSYNSIESYCDAFDINYSAFCSYRHRNHLELSEEVIEDYVHLVKRNSIEFNGKVYKSMKSCCEDLNIKYGSLYSFKFGHNFDSIELALSEYLNVINSGNLDRQFEFDGESYVSMAACCKVYNIDSQYISRYAKNHGCSFKDALSLYISKEGSTKSTRINYRGYSFPSIKDLCSCLVISYGAISSKIRNCSSTYKDAIDYCLMRSRFIINSRITYKKFLRDSLFVCKCKNCGNEFLFTRNLVVLHIEECYGILGGEKDE